MPDLITTTAAHFDAACKAYPKHAVLDVERCVIAHVGPTVVFKTPGDPDSRSLGVVRHRPRRIHPRLAAGAAASVRSQHFEPDEPEEEDEEASDSGDDLPALPPELEVDGGV